MMTNFDFRAQLEEMIENKSTFLFDCDGVIWKGKNVIDGASECIQYLKSKNKRVYFVTNNSTKSRAVYVKKMNSIGIKCVKDDIVCSGYVSAHYLSKLQSLKDKKVVVIGTDEMIEDFKEHHINYYHLKDDNCDNCPPRSEVGAIVFSLDTTLSYKKLAVLHDCLMNKDCLFIGTNDDSTIPIEDEKTAPCCGSLLQVLVNSTKRQPIIMGKPSRYTLECIAEKHKIIKEQTVMVGDRMDTDILFGQNSGLDTILVLSGVTKKEDISKFGYQPNCVAYSIAEFIGH